MVARPPAVVLEGITKSFPSELRMMSLLNFRRTPPERRTVLHDISLRIAPAEVFGLLGPNGAGKTTLLKMMATLLLPDRGRIEIGGVDALAQPLRVKGRVGLCMSEERTFYWRLTAAQNLTFFGTLAGVPSGALRERVKQVLETVDLLPAIDRQVRAFSTGMRQRLAVARALIADPEILIFDEPTRAVDPVHAEEIRHLVRDRLARQLGKTIVLSTNILEEAWSICDRVAILSGGTIAALGAPADLAATVSQLRRFEIGLDAASEDLIDGLRLVRGVSDVDLSHESGRVLVRLSLALQDDNLARLLAFVAGCGSAVRAFRQLDEDALDVFRAVTKIDSHA